MEDANTEIVTRNRVADAIAFFFESKKIKLSKNDAYISALQITTGFELGMKHNSVWDYQKEKQKLLDMLYHLNKFVDLFGELHPKVADKIESEYKKLLDQFIFNEFDQDQWPFSNTIKIRENENYEPLKQRNIFARNIVNHIHMHFSGIPFGNGAILNSIEGIKPAINVNEGKSRKKWKRINLVNAARIVWQNHMGVEAPRSLASDYENEFADFLQLIFDALDLETKPETLRAAMDSWRISYPT